MFPSLNWSPNWLSDVTSLQGIWAARLIRLAWAFLMIPCHIILVLFESYIPRSLVPVTLYDIHVNKTWSKSQKVMFPVSSIHIGESKSIF